MKDLKIHKPDGASTGPATVKDLQTVQDNTKEWTRQFASAEIAGGQMLKGISLSTGSNRVVHRLGKLPLGWFVVARSSAATIHDGSAWDEDALNLTASAGSVVSLWVF